MTNMNHDEPYKDNYLQDILSSVKTIAMVGASPDKTKFSYGVLRVLHETGYDMIPINPRPGLEEIRGLKVYPNLAAIDRPVDMVEVFRKPKDLYCIAEEAIAIGAKVLWGQIGVVNHDAARLAEEARIQAELEAGERAKQAYWDGQALPGDEAKIVPDLPADARPALDAEQGGGGRKLLIVVAVVATAGAAAAMFVL